VAAELLEVVSVDGDVRRALTAAVDDGRQATGRAKVRDLLAGDLAVFRDE
jgi:hypothetical protein